MENLEILYFVEKAKIRENESTQNLIHLKGIVHEIGVILVSKKG